MGFNKMQTLSNRLLDEHIANAVLHITAAERAAWNAKPNADHEHDHLKKSGYTISLPTINQNETISLVGHGHSIADITGLAEKLTSMLHWKGSCTKAQLNLKTAATGNEVGDVWCVTDEQNREYAWNGTIWEEIGMNVDMTLYAEKLTSGNFTAGHIAIIASNGSFSDTGYSIGGQTLAGTTSDKTLATEKAVETAIAGVYNAQSASGTGKVDKIASGSYTVGNLAKLVADGSTGKSNIEDAGVAVTNNYLDGAMGGIAAIPTTKYAVDAAKYEANAAKTALNSALDPRIQTLEGVSHHTQKFVSANVSAATVLADLIAGGWKNIYVMSSTLQIILPVNEDSIKGRSPEVSIILNAGNYSVTVSDGTNSEVLTANPSGAMIYTFGIVMTSLTSYAWVMYE